jgi:uncharacterized protein YdeI (YjbR/CyaY-like superfamily)
VKEQHFATRAAWRAWLRRHHASEAGLWLVYYKPAKGISYAESVEEALCFGWIDTTIRRLDDKRYARKFCPRVSTGHWSAINLERFRRLKREGRMTAAGLAKMEKGVRAYVPLMQRRMAIPPDLRLALARDAKARQHFERLAPSYRRHYVAWIATAKKDETRRRRLKEAVARLAKNKKLRMK